jgi:serine/threonine protein kinase
VIGNVIGSYRIVAELGRGGMGMVYRAEHTQLGRPAALKMLLPALSSDPGIVQRFFNEARAASAIDHPGIVEVYDFGTHTDGSAYIVMALLKGESLEARLRRGPMPPLEGASLIVQVLSALAAAHARGIVHRDLKPDNIFLVPNELIAGGTQIKLLDFGIAKLADDKAPGVKTQTGMMIGTPAYMSPEQCMGLPDLDHRTDIYSIGCILFHVLCGRPPFMSEHGTGMIIAAQMRDAPPDPRTFNPNIPPQLVTILLRCLEKDPAARYQSANELRNALVAAGAHGPVSKPPMSSAEMLGATMAAMPAVSGTAATAAPSIGTAPTTHSSSAAQVIVARDTKPSSTKGLWLGLGALVVVGGGIAAVALTSGGDDKPAASPRSAAVVDDKPERAKPEPEKREPAKREPEKPEPAKPAVAQPAKTVEAPCDAGKARSADTAGNCCWPGQAWSTTKSKCVGLPTCPPGTKRKAEDCIAQVATTTPTEPASPAQIATSGSPTTFKLDAKSYAPGQPITITFPAPISSTTKSRAWVTVVEAGRSPSQYGAWEYVADRATTARLVAPKQPGAYEVRLHTDYPTKSTNLTHAVPLTVAPAAEKPLATSFRFHVKAKTVRGGDNIEIVFPEPMVAAPGERFWVTTTTPDADASSYGTYEYVPPAAKTMTLRAPKATGDYEVRLHANYPTKSTNLVYRMRIHVDGD